MPIVGPEFRAAVATNHASKSQLPLLSKAYASRAALAPPIATRNGLRKPVSADTKIADLLGNAGFLYQLFTCFLRQCSVTFLHVCTSANRIRDGNVWKAFKSDVSDSRLGGTWRFARPCAAAILLMTVSSGCSANIGPAETETAFHCVASGGEQLKPAMDETAICGLFQQRIDDVLVRPVKPVKVLSAATGGDWIKVDVRLANKRSVSAIVTQKKGVSEVTHPEVAVDVMDKALSRRELEILAGEVAKLVSGKVEK